MLTLFEGERPTGKGGKGHDLTVERSLLNKPGWTVPIDLTDVPAAETEMTFSHNRLHRKSST